MTDRDPMPEKSNLDRLIREAGANERPNFVRPDDAAIEAFLLGTAQATDRALVLAAMDASESFRLEIADMAHDLEELADNALAIPGSPAEAPNLREFKGAYESARRVPFLRSRYLVAIAATLLLTVGVLLLTRLSFFNPEPDRLAQGPAWILVAPRVEAGQLIDISVRGSGKITPQTFDNPQDATLDHFKKQLKPGQGRLVPRERRLADVPGTSLVPDIEVVDAAGSVLATLRLELPRGDSTFSSGATLWALTLPSRALYQMDARAGLKVIVHPEPASEFTVYTLVTPLNGHFVATKVYILPG